MVRKFSIEMDLLLAVALGMALLAATATGFFLESSRVVDAIGQQRKIDGRLEALQQLREVLVNAESGQRGYLLTGRDTYLEPYRKARLGAEAALAAVRRNYADQPDRAAELRKIEEMFWARMADLAQAVELRRGKGMKATLAEVNSDSGLRAMQDLQVRIAGIAAAERSGLAAEMERMRGSVHQAFLMWVAGAGATAFIIGVFISLALAQVRQNRLMSKRLQHDSQHDFLTGLPNRAQFVSTLHHTLERGRREQTKAAVLYMDLDGFKPVNDHLGHEIGDLVLIEVGKKLTATIRSSDLAARLGGDEFVVLVPRTNGSRELEILGERLARAIGSITLPQLGQHHVGCSIGWALAPQDAASVDDLLAAADRAMYRVKRSGRPVMTAALG